MTIGSPGDRMVSAAVSRSLSGPGESRWPTLAIAAVCMLVSAFPLAVGVGFVADPLRDRVEPAWLPVRTLDEVPADGTPVRVPVVLSGHDAWCPTECVLGVCFLRRLPGRGDVHAWRNDYLIGAPVEYLPTKRRFRVDCLNLEFDLEGQCLSGPNRDRLPALTRVHVQVRDQLVLVRSADFPAD